MSARQQNTLVVSRWVLPSKNVLNDELALDQRKVFESSVFGTKDQKYEFKLVLNIAEKKFRLVVMKCAEPALFVVRVTNAATSNKVNAFTGRVTWTVRNYHILTRTGTLNRYRIIESPIIRSADDRIQLRVILNTHTLCFNLLTLKSPCISCYKIAVQLCGLYSQVISCDEKLESDRIVWFPWEPSEQGNHQLDLHICCRVEAESAEEYSVSEMCERNGFLLRGPADTRDNATYSSFRLIQHSYLGVDEYKQINIYPILMRNE
ncbi:hypothetical protein D918_01188 [Trichuris suis]|nr:hypothetical protein D918_01188 [Trichuris suis]